MDDLAPALSPLKLMFSNTYRNRRVLVTGHTGFKGSWLSQWLVGLGADVTGLSAYVPSTPSHFELLGLEKRLQHRVGDVRDRTAVSATLEAVQPEIIFHLAAQPIVRAAYDNPAATFETNIGGVVNVLDVVRDCPSVRAVVVITSDKCYENVEWEFGYRETDALGGKDPYSASKACAEIVFSCYARSYFAGPDAPGVASGRAGNVIGGGDWAAHRIVPDCMRAWATGAEPLIRSPRATRPWQHVLEPLSGYLWLGAQLLAAAPGLRGEAFNFGPAASVNASVEQLLGQMSSMWTDVRWRTEPVAATVKPEAGLLKLNCDKALHRLQWEAVLSFEETAAMTADWYMQHYRSGRPALELTTTQINDYERLARERRRPWAKS